MAKKAILNFELVGYKMKMIENSQRIENQTVSEVKFSFCVKNLCEKHDLITVEEYARHDYNWVLMLKEFTPVDFQKILKNINELNIDLSKVKDNVFEFVWFNIPQTDVLSKEWRDSIINATIQMVCYAYMLDPVVEFVAKRITNIKVVEKLTVDNCYELVSD